MAEQTEEQRAAEEQNKRVQEEARAKIKEDEEKRRQAQLESLQRGTTTMPTDFAASAKATEELEQPPNPFEVKEQEPSFTQPPAKNVNETTLPEETRAENIPVNEASMPSPSAPESTETTPTS